MKTIRVATRDGFMNVKADIFGGLAVHRDLEHKDYWTVTHVATGKAVLGYSQDTRDRALLALGALLHDDHVNWHLEEPRMAATAIAHVRWLLLNEKL